MEIPAEDDMRELTETGKKDILRAAKVLKSMKIRPELVASSPLPRALDGARLVAEELGAAKKLEIWEELRPDGDRISLIGRLEKMNPGSAVMLIGHEPFLSGLISELVSGKKTSRIVLKKAGMAKLSLDSVSPKLSGRLNWLLTPKLMKKLA